MKKERHYWKEKMGKKWTKVREFTMVCLFLLLPYLLFRWSDVSSLGLYTSVGVSSSNVSNGVEIEVGDYQNFALERLVQGNDRRELDSNGISCVTEPLTDVCAVKNSVKIDTATARIYASSSNPLPAEEQKIRPYPLKTDTLCMSQVTQVELLTVNGTGSPACQVNHTVPAIIFSSGGFSTNLFHDFNDILIPLFLTSHHFRSQLKFVITDFKPDWVTKYRRILTHLSAYDPIDMSKDGRVHCFTGAVIGIKYHGDLTCNASDVPSGYSIFDFRHFLQNSLSLKTSSKTEDRGLVTKKAALILISRTNSRMILNEEELIRMAMEMGFQASVASPQQVSNLDEFAQAVYSCDVLVGTHGAGMTNELFLRAGAVLVQVVPVGLEWPSTAYYGDPAQSMGINYLEYKITPNESSLSEKYPLNHTVFVDPASIHLQGYRVSRALYLDGQNVKLDLLRFKETLLQAMNLIRRE